MGVGGGGEGGVEEVHTFWRRSLESDMPFRTSGFAASRESEKKSFFLPSVVQAPAL